MSNDILVYSTDQGRIKLSPAPTLRSVGDGIIRIQRQVAGRKGKGVCVVSGFALDDQQLAALAAELKKRCGTGGSVKNGAIEIQGDKRDMLKSLLEDKGFNVKLSGG